MATTPTIVLAGGDPATRLGIRISVERDGFAVVAEPDDARAAIEAAMAQRPSACLIDEDLADGALVAVGSIFRRVPETRLLVLTGSESPRDLLAAVRAGASGFLRKDLDATRFPATIRGVLAGEAALSRRLTYRLLEELRVRDQARPSPPTARGTAITDRELDVLELLTEGLRTAPIAERLGISEVTVRRHISSAMAKLGVADREAAIAVLSGRLHP